MPTDDELDDDRPRRRRDDDYDDEDDRPRRRRERADYDEPHRGGLILALGIIGLVVCPLAGVFAWVMGNSDMRAINEGRMDPEGKQLTQIGKILGIVATVLLMVQIVFLVIYLVVIFAFVGAAAVNQPNAPPPQQQKAFPAPAPRPGK